MGHRLSRIVTRTGDSGTTGLGDGSRVDKDSLRIAAIGAVDELNSSVGALLAEPLPDAIAALLIDIQHDLFDLGGELAIPGYTMIAEKQVARLDEVIYLVVRFRQVNAVAGNHDRRCCRSEETARPFDLVGGR